MPRPRDSDAWRLGEAKARFSEMVSRARQRPQRIRVPGKADVVVISAEQYAALAPRKSFVDHLLDGPAWPDDLVEAINAARADGRTDG